MKLVIIAGGRGTRLGLKDIPKPMVKIGSVPLLEHHINLAREYGIEEIYLLSGYLSEVITDYFGDGSKFGVRITHIIENVPLGTAGAIKQLEDKINERFMIFYGDVLLDFDISSFIHFDSTMESIATIIVHPNDHPYDSDLVEINDENIITAFHSKPHDGNRFYQNMVNAGVYILSPEIFKFISVDKPSDFGKDIFPLLMTSNKRIGAYKSAEYIKDMGTADRLAKTKKDYLSGKVGRLSKRYKRPAIFIDRDGTLVEDVDLLHKTEDLQLFPFSSSAIKKINDSDYLAILCTNQPVVARNLCTFEDLRSIHNKLETLIGRDHVFLNDIYFCPHHPDGGYSGENVAFKIACDCRKPNTGMIKRAVEEYNVDIKSSWFIGDTTTDIQTGIDAGMRTILVRTGKGGRDGKFSSPPDFIFDDLKAAVDFILNEGH